ncbi:hypothetical protein FB99_45150 (plasmid) [Pantoea agglomerans]|nr:hypothetical protein FB99_45150 [Pantoea agglomerans]
MLLTVAKQVCHILLKLQPFQQYKKQHFAEHYRMNFNISCGVWRG